MYIATNRVPFFALSSIKNAQDSLTRKALKFYFGQKYNRPLGGPTEIPPPMSPRVSLQVFRIFHAAAIERALALSFLLVIVLLK